MVLYGENGLAFSDDLDDEGKRGKRWYGLCPREIMLVNFVWDEGQNILIFVGKAHATVVAGGLFKLAIEGCLKMVITGLPGCNP